MNKTTRLSVLLALLVVLAAFYFLRLGQDGQSVLSVVSTMLPKPIAMVEPVPPAKQALRRGDYAELDALFARHEATAATDGGAESQMNGMLEDLGHATDEDMKSLERWAASDSHYAQLALSQAYRTRGFLERGTAYINKIDPVRLARFEEYTRESYVRAERAAKLHPGCGVAYGLMIDALVGVSDRREIDAVFMRSQDVAPQWYSPLLSYFYALHPSWYGKEGERKEFIERFAERHPGHRAVKRMQASEYVRLAEIAINEQKYGEAMILADYAIEKNPRNSSAWEHKARAFEGVQRALDALRAFDKAIELDPLNDSAFRYRGQLRLVMGHAEGQDDFVRAGLLGDTWALKQAMWNWLTGNTAGVAKDMSRIPDLCERTRQYGMPDGVFCVATIHYFGYGVERDAKKGFEMMQEAAELGVPDAMSDVGKTYWTGEAAAGVKQDKERALRYWMRAAAIGNDRALVELSQVKNDPELLALIQKIRGEKPGSH